MEEEAGVSVSETSSMSGISQLHNPSSIHTERIKRVVNPGNMRCMLKNRAM
jgi:hypothetical protein